MLLPSGEVREVKEIGERLRLAVAQSPVAAPDGERVLVSISVGATSLTSAEQTLDALLKHADKALYDAKRQGRNQLVFASA